MNSSQPFSLRLFGNPCLARNDGSLVSGPAAQRHRLALLALLALSLGRGLSRDKLMTWLWPERDAEHARRLLNQAVYNLRKALGEEALLSAGEDLRLNTRVVGVDVLEFEAALGQGKHEAAAVLYRGPFLDGFFLSDASEFERWVDGERDRLGGAYARALEALAEAAERERDFGRAVDWWKARAAHDPYDSRVALSLMRALDAGGNRAGALQHAAVHRRLLQEEFGVEPPPELLALLEQLRSESAAGAEPGRERGRRAASAEAGPRPEALPRHDTSPSGAPEMGSQQAPGEQLVPAAPAASALVPGGEPSVQDSRAPPRQSAVRYGVTALLLAAVVFGAIRLRPAGSDTPPPVALASSIAVLPLANLSTDPRDAALADGMTEELIAVLARIDGLRVIASTSVAGFRDQRFDVRAIADSLHVGNVLEGGLQKSGSRLRVQVRLVDGRDGSTRWSETYDRELQDVFAVQDDIARRVARALGLRLGVATGTPLRRQPTENIAAYELYLRGSDRTLVRSDSAAREGLEYFQQAIALDSTYPAAWAGLGRMYSRVAVAAPIREREQHFALAMQAVEKALALDDSLAEAHAMLGVLHMSAFDFASAEQHLTRATELDPTRALTHEWIVTLYLWTGRPELALAHAERALELDHLSPTAHAELAHALLGNDRCDEALAELKKLAALQPPLLRVAPMAAQCYARQQMWSEAIAVLRPQAERGFPRTLGLFGYMLARGGDREEALRIRTTLIERWRRDDGGAFEVALVHAGLGDLDQTFAWLDRAIEDRSLNGGPGNSVSLMIVGPLLEDLRRDPRFEAVRERLGLQKR